MSQEWLLRRSRDVSEEGMSLLLCPGDLCCDSPIGLPEAPESLLICHTCFEQGCVWWFKDPQWQDCLSLLL